MSDLPAAGWYPDPSGIPGLLRYWDGAAWTDHVHQTRSQQPAPYAGYGTHPATSAAPRPTTPDGQPLAGWWHRVGATAIDSVFGAIVSVITTLPAQISIQRRSQALADELTRRLDAGDDHVFSWYVQQITDIYRDYAWTLVIPAVVIIVATAAFLHLSGGTPGQLLTGLRTRRRDAPGPLSWGRALARMLAYLGVPVVLEWVAFLSGSWVVLVVVGLAASAWSLINPLWAAWDGKRQALHDKIVGTNVVRVRP